MNNSSQHQKDLMRIERWQDFLKGYEEINHSLRVSRWNKLKVDLDSLLSEFDKLKEKLQIEERRLATQFNIFELLGIKRDETRTHSPIIADLLNSRGRHGQGSLFFHAFLQELGITIDRPFFKAANQVRLEQYTGSGYIDILIESTDINCPYCIVVENKVDATDQDKQLSRYYDFVKKLPQYDENNILLIYLKNGNFADPISMPLKLQETLKAEKKLYCVGYRNEIKRTLEKCLPLVKAEKVSAIIRQYLETIETL